MNGIIVWILLSVSVYAKPSVPSRDYLDGLCMASCRYEMLGVSGSWKPAVKQCACVSDMSLADSAFALKVPHSVKKSVQSKDQEPYESEFELPLVPWSSLVSH